LFANPIKAFEQQHANRASLLLPAGGVPRFKNQLIKII
jgi:hypothetical protein